MPSRSTITMTALVMLLAVAGPATARGTGGCGSGDFDGNGLIDGADLGVLLAQWGRAGEGDLDQSGAIDGADLGILLASWGPVEAATGTFPDMWINGGPACPTEPDLQVHWYNENMVILRQSQCTNFEAPFITLLFGESKVLMMDTGAGGIALAPVVQSLVAEWSAAHGDPDLELVVAHTHGHGDHVAGNSQFTGLPDTVVVGNSQAAVKAFFGIETWPTQIVEFDLGGRIVDIIPIPGHQSAHIAFYDRATGILFTGDTLYPGRLYISSFHEYVASIDRMVSFTADKPVCWVLGTHIEMSNTPGVDFPLGSTHHPDEHPLQLTREHLLELQAAIHAMGNDPEYQEHDDFIIFPLGGAAAARDQGPRADHECARPHSILEYGMMRRAAERG